MEEIQAWLDKADGLTATGRPGLVPRAQYDQGVVDRQKKLSAERRWVQAFLAELEVSDDPAVASFRDDQARELEGLADLIQELGRLFLGRAFMVRVEIVTK
ncbi:MAG: hypothetical protein HUU27_09695 [Phycisphaerae bacterium]|nr:hypothetical protein [Phycisphaerae bacterium]